jgi:hypothetical protein
VTHRIAVRSPAADDGRGEALPSRRRPLSWRHGCRPSRCQSLVVAAQRGYGGWQRCGDVVVRAPHGGLAREAVAAWISLGLYGVGVGRELRSRPSRRGRRAVGGVRGSRSWRGTHGPPEQGGTPTTLAVRTWPAASPRRSGPGRRRSIEQGGLAHVGVGGVCRGRPGPALGLSMEPGDRRCCREAPFGPGGGGPASKPMADFRTEQPVRRRSGVTATVGDVAQSCLAESDDGGRTALLGRGLSSQAGAHAPLRTRGCSAVSTALPSCGAALLPPSSVRARGRPSASETLRFAMGGTPERRTRTGRTS